jgi:hypothetical protein
MPGECRTFEFCPSEFGTEIEIEGLQKDRAYTVAIWGVGHGLAVERKGLKPGAKRHRLTLVPGAELSGRIHLPPGADAARVDARCHGMHAGNGGVAVVHRDGHFTVRGLLPGTWTLHVSVRAEEVWYSAKVEARPGTPVHVVPRKRGE